jgi:50S ribosomal protein L16 3-hydroxylase
MSAEAFLEEYWQQKPLFLKDALPDFRSPLAPEELAGLACEDGVTARLILEEGGARPWEVRHSPFVEEDFLELPETHWTLLVQEVDRLVPGAARLLDEVAFLPNWRLDDVMVSYAPDRGTVGPHLDSYDVFLVQGVGRRRWQIGDAPLEGDASYVEGLDVRLLDDFEPDDEFVAEPGDVLYLPPRVPHYGVALEDCMTYSVGFLAPTPQDLAAGFLEHVASQTGDGAHYRDAGRSPADPPGLVPEADRARLRAMLREALDDDAALNRWLGAHLTRPRRGSNPAPATPYSAEQVRRLLEDGAELHRSTRGDFAFVERDESTVLFAAGEAHDLSGALADAAPLLTGTKPLTTQVLDLGNEHLMKLLAQLLNDGALWIEPTG